jgi:hypothetical protein
MKDIDFNICSVPTILIVIILWIIVGFHYNWAFWTIFWAIVYTLLGLVGFGIIIFIVVILIMVIFND